MKENQVTIVTICNPFDYNDRRIRQVDHIAVKTLAGYVKDAAEFDQDQEFAVSVNGAIVERDVWDRTQVAPGSFIAICPVVGKGRSGKQILSIIASLALSVVTMGAGSAASGGSFWASSADFIVPLKWKFAGFLAATAVMFVGGMLMNHLTPKPDSDQEQSATYTWGKLGPIANQGHSVPITYGTVKNASPTVLTQHITTDGDKDYLNILLCAGDGPLDEISDVRINDNPITNYKDVKLSYRLGTNDQEVIANFNDGYADQSLSYKLTLGSWSTHLTESNVGQGLEIIIEFPAGLYRMDDEGRLCNTGVQIEAEYRQYGSSSWLPWGSWRIESNKNTTVRRSFRIDALAPAQYEVRVRCSQKDGTSTSHSNEGYWTQLSAVIYDDFLRPNKALVGIQAMATDQLSGALPSVTWIQKRLNVWVYNPNTEAYEQKPADNPAWAAYDMIHRAKFLANPRAAREQVGTTTVTVGGSAALEEKTFATVTVSSAVEHGDYIRISGADKLQVIQYYAATGTALVYVMLNTPVGTYAASPIFRRPRALKVFGAAASQIIWQEFANWAQYCQDKGLKINILIDKAADLWTTLREFENCGRGKVVLKGTRFGAIYDAPANPVQLFTVGNIIKDTFSEQFLGLRDRANAIEITFNNKEKNYERDMIMVYDPDWDTSDRVKHPTQITLNGITDPAQAYKEGKYRLRLNKHLVRIVSFEANVEAIACQVGDVILVQHDVPQWGYGGRILALERQINTSQNLFNAAKNNPDVENVADTDNGTAITAYKLDGITNGNYEDFQTNVKYNVNYSKYTIRFKAKWNNRLYYEPRCYNSSDVFIGDASFSWTINPAPNASAYQEYEVIVTFPSGTATCEFFRWFYTNVDTTSVGYLTNVRLYAWNDDTLVIDQLIHVEANKSYEVMIRRADTDEIVERSVISPAYNEETDRLHLATSLPWIPDQDDVYTFGEIDKSSKPFRVVSITRAADQKRRITAIEYIPAVYEDDIDVPVINYSALSPYFEVTGINLAEESYRLKDGPIVSDIHIGWTVPRGKNGEFWIYYMDTEIGSWRYAGKTAEKSFTIPRVVPQKTYRVKISTINDAGVVSPGVQSTDLYVTGKDRPPSDVTGFTAQIDPSDRARVNFTWNQIADQDLSYYNIYEGETLANATRILTGIKATTASWRANETRLHTFWILAADNSDNLSASSVSAQVNPIVEASDITGFTVSQLPTDRSKIVLSWNPSSDIDIAYYEIRRGANWSTGTVIASQLKSTTFTYTLPGSGYYDFWIKAINTAGKPSVNAATIGGQFYIEPGTPSGPDISQDPLDRSIAIISWTGTSTPEDLREYQIKEGSDWSTGTLIGSTKETSIRYKLTESKLPLRVMIRAYNVSGNPSAILNYSENVTIEPAGVTNFTGAQIVNETSKVRLTWDPIISQNDIDHYEIREGATWATATVVNKDVKGVFFDYQATQDRAYTFWIAAVNKAGKYSLNPTSYITGFSWAPPAPTALTVTTDPTDRSKAIIHFTGIANLDLAEYQIKQGLTWETAALIAVTKETSITWSPPATNDYVIRVKAKTTGGFWSNEVTYTYSAKVEPSDVAVFSASQNGDNVLLVWERPADADIAGFEIREGNTWDTSALIETGITNTQYQFKADNEVTRKFWIKAINRAGNYSANAATSTVIIDNLPPKNVIQSFDEIALQTGTKTNVEFAPSVYTFASLGGKFSDYPTTRFSEIGGAQILRLKNLSLVEDGSLVGSDLSKWGSWGSMTIAKNAAGNLLATATAAATTGPTYNFPETLDRSTIYVVEGRIRANKTVTSSLGFIGSSGGFAGGACTPNSQTVSLTANTWTSFKLEFTTAATGVEPDKLLLGYHSQAVNDWVEIEWLRIYKKADESKFQAGIWHEAYESAGEYIAAQKDLGKVVSANLSAKFVATTLRSAGTSAALEYRTSQDGITWTDWKPFIPALVTLRYIEYRAKLATTDPTKTPEVNQFEIQIDVPDVVKSGSATIPVGGAIVNYGHTYYSATNVSFIPIATEPGKRAEYNGGIGVSSCPVKVVNAITGVDVGGSITWISKGF